MPDPRAQRTLVKSPPELWAEISDVATLARHLGEFGEIRITRTEPETTVVWEGDRARGTVELEPAGWGTKVTLTAQVVEPEPVAEDASAEEDPPLAGASPGPAADASPAEPAPAGDAPPAEAEPVTVPEPEPVIVTATAAPEPPATEPAPQRGLFARFFGRRRRQDAAPASEPVAAGLEPVAAGLEPVAPVPEPPAAEPEPEPVATDPIPAPAPDTEPEPESEPAVAEPAVTALDAERAEAVLVGVLDDLGSAHHRPFSRG